MDDEIRRKILTLLDQHRIMTIATLRPDGWPQATTVGYVNEGLTLYFLCGLNSQKAANLARDDRVSLTIDHDTPQVMEITGLSLAARAQTVSDPAEANKILRMLPLKYPEQVSLPGPMPTAEQVDIFKFLADRIRSIGCDPVNPLPQVGGRRAGLSHHGSRGFEADELVGGPLRTLPTSSNPSGLAFSCTSRQLSAVHRP
jgi:nitroimidazol reductase NimA-like FMN-containing flavoprotein (pyridoxamine 5'-phosphate oxidase superfamily)